MPSAASGFFPRVMFIAWSGFCLAVGAPSLLIDEKFESPVDSLWHFQTTAFKEGVLSPGLEVDVRGRGFATGQLRVDPSASALRFIPRHGSREHRSCFLGYRSDFRMDSVFARHVQVQVTGDIVNPAAADSVGGLYVLVRYADDLGYPNMARTTLDIRGPQTIDLDTAQLVPIRKTDWFGAPPLNPEILARARSQIIGVGLCYISQSSAAFNSQSLLVGGFRARGELSWPPIPGSPRSAEVMAGDTLTLAWKMPPAIGASFRWYRNEKRVPDAQGRTYLFRPGAEDARIHVFRAEALLANGDVIPTEQLRIKVARAAPPAIHRQSGDTTVPEGGNAIFRVQASGLQPLAFQWFRKGKPIPGAKEAFYTFVPTSSSEGGPYHCEVSDKRGVSVNSRTAILIVKPGTEQEGGLPLGLVVGPRFGFNVSDFYRDRFMGTASQFKWNLLQAGLDATWQLSPSWALQAEMLYSRKGVLYEFEDHSSTYSLDYLEWPLMLRVRPGRWMRKSPLSLILGGYGALLVNATEEEDWGSWKGTGTLESLEALDYGGIAGMSWQMGILSLEWRYSLGLADLEGGRAGHPRMNGALSAMVGFTLFTAQEAAR